MPSQAILKKQRQELKRVLDAFPDLAADMTVNFFTQRFISQGWFDRGFRRWKPRNATAKRNKGRNILTNTGRLRLSIRKSKAANGSIVVGTDVPYAKAHNEGFNGTVSVKAHSRTRYKKEKRGTGKLTKTGKERMMTVRTATGSHQVKAHSRKLNLPQRQFMGDSAHLRKIISRKLETETAKIFR